MEKNKYCNIYSIVKSPRKTSLLCQTSHSTLYRWINNPNKKTYIKPNKIYKSDQIVNIETKELRNYTIFSVLFLLKKYFLLL